MLLQRQSAGQPAPTTRSRRRLQTITAIVLTAAAMGIALVPANPAAAAADLVCTGTQTTTYTPGLTLNLQPVRADIVEDYDYCPVGPFSDGIGFFSLVETASCLVAAGLPTDVFTYRWNTGKTSTVTYTVTTVVRLANGTTNVTSTG
uniref:hypothetical protein n=1 Tax=Allorhizocola rhizosphaerae TaxID=1872709 RepID=UPI0013C32610